MVKSNRRAVLHAQNYRGMLEKQSGSSLAYSKAIGACSKAIEERSRMHKSNWGAALHTQRIEACSKANEACSKAIGERSYMYQSNRERRNATRAPEEQCMEELHRNGQSG